MNSNHRLHKKTQLTDILKEDWLSVAQWGEKKVVRISTCSAGQNWRVPLPAQNVAASITAISSGINAISVTSV